jgi:maltooligosyltrehalose trehalohydrolase
MNKKDSLGAVYLGDGRCRFLVWVPLVQRVDVHIVSPGELTVPLKKDERGYHRGTVDGVMPGSLYFYRLDDQRERPDPASRCQPHGVHGPSQVVDTDFPWRDGSWSGLPLEEYIIYELHVGTFTQEGTFEAIIPYLEELSGLGITALELTPVAQFPGNRNWGYDGVYPFAVQHSYGGPDGLKSLVDTCHRKGLAIVLDVVYNHFGPEGNYIADFGPYFTDRYKTPWGAAINFDGPYSDEVRRFFIENALYWLTDFHIDALRLDALHAIMDVSAYTFLEELSQAFHREAKALKRKAYLIGESTANDARLIKPQELGGYGLDAQWNDDFHHSLHTLLTGERNGYYQDFGQLEHLVKAFREGFVYSGQYSRYRQRRHGVSSRDIPAGRFVVFAQNHDQVGNRMHSERLSQLACFEVLKLAAGIVLLSPFIPLIFMGEEYGDTAPFLYFISHSEPELVEAIRRGRREEFAAFQWQGEPPDPQNEAAFLASKLNWQLRSDSQHRILVEFYRELIHLRREIPALACLSKDSLEIKGFAQRKLLFLHRWNKDNEVVAVFNINEDRTSVRLPIPAGRWRKGLDSSEERWRGIGSTTPEQISSNGEADLVLNPWSLVLFVKET